MIFSRKKLHRAEKPKGDPLGMKRLLMTNLFVNPFEEFKNFGENNAKCRKYDPLDQFANS